jgi:putative DNA primase/helicase
MGGLMSATIELASTPGVAAWRKAAADLFGARKREGYQTVGLHLYRSIDGAILYARVRMHKPKADGGREKLIRPFWHDGARWVCGEPKQDAGKLLYGLPELCSCPDATVFIVEGEQKADAITMLGAGRAVGLTSGGAPSAGGADWIPLAGRRVILWPDHDAPGQRYADEVAEALRVLGCAVERLDVAGMQLPASGDVVDWLAAFAAAHGRPATIDDLLDLPKVTSLPSVDRACSVVLRPSVLLTSAAAIVPEPIRWLWPGWVPRGKLTLLAGSPGTGKTTMALSLAATITTGGAWPDGSVCPEPGNVLMWSGEDDPADTLVPRLIAAGADLNKVHFVMSVSDGNGELQPFDPSRDIPLLGERLADLGGASLLIVDPIVSAVSGDAHRVNDVRRNLQSLVDLASAYRCAVLGISHFAKGTKGRSPAERVIGSQAFVALARVVLVAGKDEAAERRILARAKSNIAPDDCGVSYTLAQVQAEGLDASRVVWGAMIEGTARDILGEIEHAPDDDERTERDDAIVFLTDLLADGPMPVRTIRGDAVGAGYAWRTIERAKRELGIEARKAGLKEGWIWALPPEDRHGAPEHRRSLNRGGLRVAWRSSATEVVSGMEKASDFDGLPEGRHDS